MTLLKGKQEKDIIESGYTLTIETMEGDADDYHQFELFFEEDAVEELKQHIIWCEVLARQYPNGMGGCDSYDFDFFDEHFSEEWFYSEHCDSYDSFDGYDIVFTDEAGVDFDIDVIFTEEELAEIASYGILE